MEGSSSCFEVHALVTQGIQLNPAPGAGVKGLVVVMELLIS